MMSMEKRPNTAQLEISAMMRNQNTVKPSTHGNIIKQIELNKFKGCTTTNSLDKRANTQQHRVSAAYYLLIQLMHTKSMRAEPEM